MQWSVNFGLGAKKIFLTEDHWLVVEAQSSSFLSSRTLSDICPLHRCFLPTAPFEWICQTKKIEARFLLFAIAWQVNLKPETLSFRLLYFHFGHFRYSGHLRLFLGPLSTLGAFGQFWHFWALRGPYGNLLVSSSSIFRAKCTYLGGS